MESPQTKQPVPAYVSYKTFISFISGLHDSGIPHQIDRSVLSKMSGSGQSTMMKSLEFLGLIDENSTPTLNMQQLVENINNDYSTPLRNVLTESYDFLHNGSIDLTRATTMQVEKLFKEKGASGSTVTKCISFYLAAAKDAGIQLSPHIKPPKVQRVPTAKKKKYKNNSDSNDRSQERTPPPPPPKQKSWHEILVGKFPDFDPSWDSDTQKAWFAAFNDLMNKGEPE